MRDNKYLRDRSNRRSGRRDKGRIFDKRGRRRDRMNDRYEIYGEMRRSDDYGNYDGRRVSVNDGHYDDYEYYERFDEYDRNGDYYDGNYDSRRDRRYDYGDYDEVEYEYKEDLDRWIKNLKKKDRFNLSKEQVLQKAKEMNVKLDKISDDEFYAAYLMMSSDYGDLANDPHMILAMTKKFIEDNDIAVSPSEKICIYMYKIVKGE